MSQSFAVEVQADSTGNWAGNGCRYPSKVAAEWAARDLMARWWLVTAWRVVESDDPPNYDVVDGRVVEYDHAAHCKRVMAALELSIAKLGGPPRRSRARGRADNERGLP
jgi:hypothetical protein